MNSTADARSGHPAWSGLLVAVIATAAWALLLGYATELVNEDYVRVLVIGTAALFGLGVLLCFSDRPRRFGIGLAVGAPVALVVGVVIRWYLIAGDMY
jgi:Na+-transporting NADH:ubiquinone oxidoreductase subunit NqrD